MKNKIQKKKENDKKKSRQRQSPDRTKNPSEFGIKDLQQLAGNRAVQQMINIDQGRKTLTIQRRPTTVDAPFIGGSPFNDSDVTFTPRGVVWVGGAQTSSTDFPDGLNGTIQIRAGTQAVVQLHCNVHVFEDNILINQRWDQSFYVSWNVTAARDGRLTIEPNPSPTINPRDGSTSQSALQSINPSQGSNYVQVSPVVTGPGASGGISIGVGIETSYPASIIQRSFQLRIEVIDIPEPESQVTIGPIQVLRQHEVLFERPGQSTVSGDQENQIISWFESLPQEMKDQIIQGSEPVNLEGHASTTGDAARNRELSNNRMLAVQRILTQYAGNRVNFQSRAVGEYQATTGDDTESQEERKVVISAWETFNGP